MTRREDAYFEAGYLAATRGGDAEDYLDEKYRRANGKRQWNYASGELTSGDVVDEYIYKDKSGDPYLRVRRMENKQFPQSHWEGNCWEWGKPKGPKIPYRLPELIAAASDEPVFVCEGEKDADNIAALDLVATTASEGAGKWINDLNQWFSGKQRVYILQDNDSAGRRHAIQVAQNLTSFVKEIRIVALPHLNDGGDVSDWFEQGGTKELLIKLCEEAPIYLVTEIPEEEKASINATPFVWIEPSKIPIRRWLYKPNYIRKFVSLTVSTGGVGKSSLVIAEALAMASGKPLLNIQPSHKMRVWYWNGEDPLDELQRRFVAAIKHYKLQREDIAERLFLDSGRVMPIVIAEDQKQITRVATPVIEKVIATIREKQIEVLIIDPFVSCHHVSENDNTAIERVAKSWSRVAEEVNGAVMLVHHSRKTGGESASVDDGRGASALLAAARSARVLNAMTVNEARGAEVDEFERRLFFRSDLGKTNLTQPSESAGWFKLTSVDLENAELGEDLFNSDQVGVVTSWKYPKTEALKPSVSDIQRVQNAIKAGGPWRENRQVKREVWVGEPIARALGLDFQREPTKRALVKLIADGVTRGWLKKIVKPDSKREPRIYIECGDAPPIEAGQR